LLKKAQHKRLKIVKPPDSRSGQKMRRRLNPEADAAQNITRSRGSSRTSEHKLAGQKIDLKMKELLL
jgi:hypothetical protein